MPKKKKQKQKSWKQRNEEAQVALVQARLKMCHCGNYATANALSALIPISIMEYKAQINEAKLRKGK